MQSVGRHFLVDCWGCGRRAEDADGIEQAVLRAVAAMGVTLLELRIHRFDPQGLTAVAILAESHLAVHSWPEGDYIAIDAFTCGRDVRAEAGLEVLLAFLRPERTARRSIARGYPPTAAAVEPQDDRRVDSQGTGREMPIIVP